MKLTNEKTESILLKAVICSEWDYCNAALLESVTEETIERWKRYDTISTNLKNEHSGDFHCLTIWEDCTFLNLDEDRDNQIELKEGFEWSYVTDVTEEEIEEQRPEQRINSLQLKFYGNGNMCFLGYGKHTSEEFYTETINLNKL